MERGERPHRARRPQVLPGQSAFGFLEGLPLVERRAQRAFRPHLRKRTQPMGEQLVLALRPPCGGAQVERAGGCWSRVHPEPSKLKAGEACSPELYQSGKDCYLPVLDSGPSPVARNP
jgi:hypothetical protein